MVVAVVVMHIYPLSEGRSWRFPVRRRFHAALASHACMHPARACEPPRQCLQLLMAAAAPATAGHPNAEMVQAVLCGLWPVVLVVATLDIPAGTHVS